MEGNLGMLVSRLTEVYVQQKKLYDKLSEITVMETAAIRNRDLLQVIELLQLENELMGQVHVLDEEQKKLKNLVCRVLPGQSLSMDQLACAVEPSVSIALKAALTDLKELLGKIEQLKSRNVCELGQSLKFLEAAHPC